MFGATQNVRVRVCEHVYMCVCEHARMRVCVCVPLRARAWACACVHVCMCVYEREGKASFTPGRQSGRSSPHNALGGNTSYVD